MIWYTTYYFDVLEKEEEEEGEYDEDWVFSFGNEEPGDKIHLFTRKDRISFQL